MLDSKNGEFEGRRVTLSRVITIEADPGEIFPLLCPVRESEWVDGWDGRAVFSSTGHAETNGVFATKHPGEDDTIWFVTRRDETTHEIEFVFFMPALQVVRLFVRVVPTAPSRSNIEVEYVRTGLSEKGNESIGGSSERFNPMMEAWERSLNHYIKTGTLLEGGH